MNNNDRPFEMKSQEPSDTGDNTPIFADSEEETPLIGQPASRSKSDQTLWLIIGGITVAACVVFSFLLFNLIRGISRGELLSSDFPTPVPTIVPEMMTATQRAWIPPSAQPTFASASEARKAVETNSALQLEFFTERYPPQPGINQPGDVYLFDIFIEPEQPAIWDYGWCTTTQEILDQNFAQMKTEFIVNGKILSADLFAVTEYDVSNDSGRCRVLSALITHWPDGAHHMDVNVTFLRPTDDGWNVYPAGTHTFRYFVNVK